MLGVIFLVKFCLVLAFLAYRRGCDGGVDHEERARKHLDRQLKGVRNDPSKIFTIPPGERYR